MEGDFRPRHGRRGLAAEPWPWKVEAAFRENEIDETVLQTLTADDLKDLGVAALGDRRKLLDAPLLCAPMSVRRPPLT